MQLTLYKTLDFEEQTLKYRSTQHQKTQMKVLYENIKDIKNKKIYFKANSLANKAVRMEFGLKNTIYKKDMTPEMLEFRDKILNKIVKLLIEKEKGHIEHIAPLVYENINYESKNNTI